MIKEQRRPYVIRERDNHEKEYYMMVQAKDMCEEFINESNNMEEFVNIVMSNRLTETQRKFVLHVASCGTFFGKEGSFQFPTTKACMTIMHVVGFRSTLENIYVENGIKKTKVYDRGYRYII